MSASPEPRRWSCTACRYSNSARWPTAAVVWPRPMITMAKATTSSPISSIATSTTPTSAMSTRKFCAFWRLEKQDDSYVITHDEIDKKIEETVALGGTQILMQGGHHPKLDSYGGPRPAIAHPGQVSANQHPRLQPERVYPLSRCIRGTAGDVDPGLPGRGLGSIPGGGGKKFWWTRSATASRRSRQ